MPRVALTDRFCSTAKPMGTRTDYFDVTVHGLALRVTESGHRSWSYLFTSPRDDKRARATIGTYPATTLAAARAKALEARGYVEAGQDPRLVLAGQGVAGMTVTGLVDAYLADPVKAALRSKAEIERRLRKNVIPLIGAVKVGELHRRDLLTVTNAILRRGRKVEANRVFEDVRAMVRWAVRNGYLDANPLDIASKPDPETKTRNRALNDDEIRTLWAGLPAALPRSLQCQRIIKLCLVTGQRVGEVAGMMRTELSLAERKWTLPGSRTKNKHDHVVPLSDLALQIIKEASAEANDNAAIFPCGTGALSPVAVARTILRANEISDDRPLGRFGIAPWSAHDLRRTALTRMAGLGVAPLVLGHVANHRTTTRAGVTLAVYNRYDYEKEKRAALDLWASRIEAICGGPGAATIVPLRRRRAGR